MLEQKFERFTTLNYYEYLILIIPTYEFDKMYPIVYFRRKYNYNEQKMS